jgi:hypothetical protein
MSDADEEQAADVHFTQEFLEKSSNKWDCGGLDGEI